MCEVWIIDDSENYLELCAGFLNDEGYKVRTFLNGGDAVNSLNSNSHPRVMLVDASIKPQGGRALIGDLRKAGYQNRIIAQSANGIFAEKLKDVADVTLQKGDAEELRISIKSLASLL